MTEKEFIQIQRNREQLKTLKSQIDDLAYKSLSAGQQITGMPFVSGTSDNVGDHATRISALEDKYIRLFLKNQRLERKAKNLIHYIPDDDIQTILYLKYFISWDNLRIADSIGLRGNNRDRQVKSIIKTFFLDYLFYM